MAKDTSVELRNLFIYQVYLRQHTEEGTFSSFLDDLDRIKSMGVDVIHFLPIHPIGIEKKKGDLGCPYSISDYMKVNDEYGTLEDFKNLIEECHKAEIKVMIDVVFNHTSHDSDLLKNHPEWFYRNEQGELANRVGDWWDITDLDFGNKDLWTYLIEVLKYWTEVGVDGYRCDVASLIPLDFWLKAREEVAKLNPDTIWLSESVHSEFLKYIRDLGFDAWSESEIYQAFDIAYDYDTHKYYESYLKGEGTFEKYLDAYIAQMWTYPKNFVKMRNLENHDFGRFAPMVDHDINKIHQWTALSFFQYGCTLIYAGQEHLATTRPDLFDYDKVEWDQYKDISNFISIMNELTTGDLFTHGVHSVIKCDIDGVFIAEYKYLDQHVIGVFNVGLSKGQVKLDVEDGTYINVIYDEPLSIKKNSIKLGKKPVLFYL